MPYIKTNNKTAGIRGLMEYRPQTGVALQKMAHSLLVENSNLTRFEREMIATYVSFKNKCQYCTKSHSAIAYELATHDEKSLVQQMLENIETASLSPKLRGLLSLAELVQKSGQLVSVHEVEEIKKLGVTDEEVHDTVLIAAAFCMFNRYVDGLSAELPSDDTHYAQNAKLIAERGYAR